MLCSAQSLRSRSLKLFVECLIQRGPWWQIGGAGSQLIVAFALVHVAKIPLLPHWEQFTANFLKQCAATRMRGELQAEKKILWCWGAVSGHPHKICKQSTYHSQPQPVTTTSNDACCDFSSATLQQNSGKICLEGG